MQRRSVHIPVTHAVLDGDLVLPTVPGGLVLFAHGSGSSRRSPRNQAVAAQLHAHGLGTLLFDLLTPDEDIIDEVSRQFRFDIELLADRLVQATDWCLDQPTLADRPMGFFGASTGAAAALIAAARRRDVIRAVVSRGGRPDLAADWLPQVKAPTLLIVGGNDEPAIRLNQQAAQRMTCERRIAIVPRATHLFGEPGALEAVGQLASDWFAGQLTSGQLPQVS
ncbi:MAG: dienelactone hydrolase family protein [Candidatus Sericytochromatia bacterium]|nr:dienelactone hydrolase family protein [Candidatus Sericytochromatia bacterium]